MTGARADALLADFPPDGIAGPLLVVEDAFSDLLVHGGALRDTVRVLAARAADVAGPTLRYTIAGAAEPVVAPGGPAAAVPDGITAATPPTIAIDLLRDHCVEAGAPHLLVLDFGEHLLPPDGGAVATGDAARILEQLAELAVAPAWRRAGHRLVVVGRTAGVDDRLLRLPGVRLVRLGLPGLDERQDAVRLMLRSPRRALHLAPGLTGERLARLAGGLTLHELTDLRDAASPDRPVRIEQIVARKQEAIRRSAGDALRVHDEPLDLERDVAGVPQVRDALEEEILRGGETIRLILAGPPGTGKSRVAIALAARLGVPAIELGLIRARYVGDSEANMRRALDTIEANAPALLIIDEADQSGLGRRGETTGGDGEVSANLRAALFAWLGDAGARAGVSVVALTNRPDLLDEAAADRFAVVPVLHPSAEEAADIMAIHARKQGIALDADGAYGALAHAGGTWSGRTVVRLLARAHLHALRASADRVRREDVDAAIAEAVHGVSAAEIRQSLLALDATSWTAHLPWVAAARRGRPAAPPVFLRDLVRADGSLDRGALGARLAGSAASRA